MFVAAVSGGPTSAGAARHDHPPLAIPCDRHGQVDHATRDRRLDDDDHAARPGALHAGDRRPLNLTRAPRQRRPAQIDARGHQCGELPRPFPALIIRRQIGASEPLRKPLDRDRRERRPCRPRWRRDGRDEQAANAQGTQHQHAGGEHQPWQARAQPHDPQRLTVDPREPRARHQKNSPVNPWGSGGGGGAYRGVGTDTAGSGAAAGKVACLALAAGRAADRERRAAARRDAAAERARRVRVA
ncbi:MAG: hypothetical protein V9E83_07190 [Baekduia sp.]